MPKSRKIERSVPQPESSTVLEYLRTASPSLLQEFELHRLNHVQNMQKEVVRILERIIEEKSEARLARLLLEHGRMLFDGGQTTLRPLAAEMLSELFDKSAKQAPKLLNAKKQ